MSFIEKLKQRFSKKDDNSPAARYAFAQNINNRHVRYVTEREDGQESVIGRAGHINILPNGEEIAVTCGIEEIFRARIEDVSMWTLMSNDGVVFEGYDFVAGRERTVTAFYLYYR